MNNFKTEQEFFWAGEFGNEYINRNKGEVLLANNISLFNKALSKCGQFNSLIEFGANIGMNIRAIKKLFPKCSYTAVEINKSASEVLLEFLPKENVINDTILNIDLGNKYDVVLIKGVLIHQDPNSLSEIYEVLYKHSSKYVLMIEYYSPYPTQLEYRGHKNRLFKRDFAGEFLDYYSDFDLEDYGFIYRRDPTFPQDDITWFLLKKK